MTEKIKIPDRWEYVKLGTLGEWKKGKEVSTCNTIVDGLPAMMYGDIYVKYNTKFDSVDYRISPETADKSTAVYTGDLLFTCSGETAEEIGKCVCYTGDKTIYIGGDILALTPSKADSMFLAYQQNDYRQIKQKARLGQGHSVVHIYLDAIKSLNCLLPPLPEQRKIAEILNTCDKVIELKEKLITEKQKQKKVLMAKLLSPKKGWKTIELGDKALKISDGNYGEIYPSSDEMKNEGVPFISANNIIDGGISWYGMRFIDEDKHRILLSGHLESGDILIVVRGEIGKIAYVSSEFENANINAQLALIRVDNENYIYNKYLFYELFGNKSQKQFLAFSSGSALKQLPIGKLKKIKALIPPTISEQIAIANILSTADNEIELLKQELNEWKNKKIALMQVLLTGKVRTMNNI